MVHLRESGGGDFALHLNFAKKFGIKNKQKN